MHSCIFSIKSPQSTNKIWLGPSSLQLTGTQKEDEKKQLWNTPP